jgi:type-F conjugative transfer system pilin assembly protein TrbC
MIARTLAGALVAVASTLAQAQALPTAPSSTAIEALMEAQRSRAATAIDDASRSALMPKRAPEVDMDRAVQMGGADPLAIAKQYEQGLREAPQEAIYIFISTSVPIDTLKLLGEQAVRGGAALVLRGIPGGFDGYTKMLQTLKPVIATGADIQIHPELFDRFEVSSVPAFVIAKYEEGCQGNVCDAESISVAGDVSLPFALEHLASRPNPLSEVAKQRLQRFR